SYTKTPRVEFQLGSGRRALDTLRRWLIPASGTKGLPLSFGEDDHINHLTWSTGPFCTGDGIHPELAQHTIYLHSNKIKSTAKLAGVVVLRFPLDVILGDFTGVVWWLRQQTP